MPHIKVISHEESAGRLRQIYDDLIAKRGKLADVHKIQSLRPESIVKHMDLYMEIMYSRSELSRAQREMIAVVVSEANGCEYCQFHHREALNFYWKDDERIDRLVSDFSTAGLSDSDEALCEYAYILTREPSLTSKPKFIDRLKTLGLSDGAILDTALVIGYFNFVNRIVLGLGVELEEDSGKGYNYG